MYKHLGQPKNNLKPIITVVTDQIENNFARFLHLDQTVFALRQRAEGMEAY